MCDNPHDQSPQSIPPSAPPLQGEALLAFYAQKAEQHAAENEDDHAPGCSCCLPR